MNKIALITGATSGIGKATAYELAKIGFKLILCGRRKDILDSIEKDLSKVTSTSSLCFDVSINSEVTTAISSLPKNWMNVDVLINNAGNAHGMDYFQDGNVVDWDKMIDINVKGLMYVTKAIINNMIDNSSGHIINIGSLAGREVYPMGNVYCASKYAVKALSQSLRLDLNNHNIKISEINPGLVETSFSDVRFKGDKNKSSRVYKGYKALQAQDIAEIISFVITRPYHINIADLLVLPSAQASSTIINKK
ncbi:SDR family NAD(P)-dependent oxidoreductase [Flavobacteriaceae bacterium]|nr:SDR family NAD(P)-dependent oxidoreductase [Flavobacteriaceae bacterium]MDB9712934.1 SDR family NAD(P)-dependent oxidoreductase [Flavobacteriaceae bacterium]MDC1492099.1 SDR family NAD(P)-dependent oxidoreductase [Flavobacteriaceae bacterium]